MLPLKNRQGEVLAILVERNEIESMCNALNQAQEKLDGIQAGAQVNPDLSAYATLAALSEALTGYVTNADLASQLATKAGTGTASQSAAGLMSAADKTKLDGIAAGANAYALPAATDSARGGVKTGYAANGRNYPVQLANEQMFVNVPWTDTNTTYAAASQSAAGLMSAADKLKLDGIAAGAQVNQTLAQLGGVTSTWVQNLLAAYISKKTVNNVQLNLLQESLQLLVATPEIKLCAMGITLGSNPAVAQYWNFSNADKDGNSLGHFAGYMDTSGTYQSYIAAWNNKLTSRTVATLRVQVSAAGVTRYYLGHNPADTSNTTDIATTQWARARIAAATGKGATTFSLGQEPAIMTLADGVEACAWQPNMITEDMREAAMTAIKEHISTLIFTGFNFVIKGKEFFFTYDLYDQQNISDAAILAGQKWM